MTSRAGAVIGQVFCIQYFLILYSEFRRSTQRQSSPPQLNWRAANGTSMGMGTSTREWVYEPARQAQQHTTHTVHRTPHTAHTIHKIQYTMPVNCWIIHHRVYNLLGPRLLTQELSLLLLLRLFLLFVLLFCFLLLSVLLANFSSHRLRLPLIYYLTFHLTHRQHNTTQPKKKRGKKRRHSCVPDTFPHFRRWSASAPIRSVPFCSRQRLDNFWAAAHRHN